MVGRIETYTHSDSITQNKGAAIVKVECDTDFAARTGDVIAFAKLTASRAYAASADVWQDVVNMFPEMETDRKNLAALLKEKIEVSEIVVLKL